MSEILCKWLNEEIQLSKKVDSNNFSECFSNGYLIGELLHRYGLQEDFEQFSIASASEAKLNNFSRIEPTLSLLDVRFDSNMAKEMISERPGMATRLLYQLFIALGKKTKMNLTGAAMETMRPQAPARLGVIKTDMYKEVIYGVPQEKGVDVNIQRLKTLVPRQVDLDFDELVYKYSEKQKEQEEKALERKQDEEERYRKYQQTMRQQGLERSRQIREKQETVMRKIKDAAVKIPKPPNKKKSGKTSQEISKEKEIQSVYKHINEFEKSLGNVRAVSPQSSNQIRDIDADIEQYLNESPNKQLSLTDIGKPEDNNAYVSKIRQRLSEDEHARKEREKRRRRVLIEQMKVLEVQQENAREDVLVNRLMRQSQMERRIVVQLMHVRHEKEVIKQNRLEKEKQFSERRLQDFQDALEREAEMCRQAKLEYADEVCKAKELHNSIAAERAQQKYEKHYDICQEILLDIFDFASKVGQYRELTEKKLPPKIVREWKTLFVNSKSVYEEPLREYSNEEIQAIGLQESKEQLLDDEDFLEYKNFVGEWISHEKQLPSIHNNNILGFVLKRLNDILYPPTPPPPEPQFPAFPIKACVLGKLFSGKTTAIQQIVATHRIELLDVELILEDSIVAWKNQEMFEVIIPASTTPQLTLMAPSDDALVTTETVDNSNKEQVENTDSTTANPKESTAANSKEPTTANSKEVKDTSDAKTSDATEDNKEIITSPTKTNEDSIPVILASESTESSKSDKIEMHLTERARLGEKATEYLDKGQVIPDSLLVDILVSYIRNIPEGTGWILDSFPRSYQQAKLLEKSLTGYSPGPSPRKSNAQKDTPKKNRKSRLAQDPLPSPELKPPKSGLDVVILFDVDDEIVLQRAEGRSFDPDTGEEYHEEFNSPPDGAYSGLQSKTRVQSLVDSSNDREQAQLRLTTFQDNWPKLERWFNRFKILQTIPSDSSPDDVYQQLQSILDETLQAMFTPPPPPEEEIVEETKEKGTSQDVDVKKQPPEGEVTVLSQPETPVEPAEVKEEIAVVQSDLSGKESEPPKKKKERQKSAKGKKGKKDRSPSPGKRSDSKNSNSSKKSSRSSSKEKKASVDKLEETVVQPEEPPKPPSPLPGSEEWVYANGPIDTDFVSILLDNWEIIEETYIASCKHVFRNVRNENETIYRYFYETRKQFVSFLKRPDDKQLYVSQWQREYNDFPEDMRSDEESKAELHQRVDDLCDRLWDICDVRKEDAENERSLIMTEGWLEDHIGLLINHFISLIQTEVDRFQQSCKMMKDYYVAMEGGVGPEKTKLISEGIPSFTRVPLVDLPITLPPLNPMENIEGGDTNMSPSQLSASVSTYAKPSKTPEPPPIKEEKKPGRIPLVPREAATADQHSPSRNDRKKLTPRKERTSEEKLDSPIPPTENDEKLLFDAVVAALHIIEIQGKGTFQDDDVKVQNHADVLDAESDATQPAGGKADHKDHLAKTSSKEKKKKDRAEKRSPSKSKSHVQPSAVPAQPSPNNLDTMSEEEKEKFLFREKIRKEYKSAVVYEGKGLQTRVEAIRIHAQQVVKKLKEKADATYTDMDKWLGKRFLEEMDSIEKMTEVMRNAIENEVKLQDASVLEDKEFYIDEDLHVFKTPTPPPPETPKETITEDIFTCLQLKALLKQFQVMAPTGLINIKSFLCIMNDLPSTTIGLEALPEKWEHVTAEQLENIAALIFINNEYLSWKKFLLYIATPYAVPSSDDLFDALTKYKQKDVETIGYLTYDEFIETVIWLDEDDVITNGYLKEDVYDRVMNLKQLFFDIFAVETSEGILLDYTEMLLYFVENDDPLSGLLTSLSLCCYQKIPPYFKLRQDDGGVENDGDKNDGDKTEDNVNEKPADDAINQINSESDQSAVNDIEELEADGFDLTVNIEQWLQNICDVPQEKGTSQDVNVKNQVLYHGECGNGGYHRFSQDDAGMLQTMEKILAVYTDLGYKKDDYASLKLLYEHPIMRDMIDACNKYIKKDIFSVFHNDDEQVASNLESTQDKK